MIGGPVWRSSSTDVNLDRYFFRYWRVPKSYRLPTFTNYHYTSMMKSFGLCLVALCMTVLLPSSCRGEGLRREGECDGDDDDDDLFRGPD